jgi:hypothetical protein
MMLKGMALMTGCSHYLEGPIWKAGQRMVDLTKKRRADILAGIQPNPSGKGAPVPQGPLGDLGKLGVREEPGKLRLFAMVDIFTQWVLSPLHLALFDILKRIPQDGTFNQTKPVEELIERCKSKGQRQVYSYDLSAATDRLPLVLQVDLLAEFAGRAYAECWSAVLCDRFFRLPDLFVKTFGRKAGISVKYAVGQPMGALSSWAMLAITHHAIVQFAAKRAGWRGWFGDYAVLGDDVVIANGDVAKEYVSFMKEIGVDIGFHKSIVSSNLSLEFAKRFYHEGVEVTPFPLVGIAVGWLGVAFVPEVIRACEALTKTRFTSFVIARYLGYGMRMASKAGNNRLERLSRRLYSVLILMLHPGSIRGLPRLSDWWAVKSYQGQHFSSTTKDRDAVFKFVLSYVKERLMASLEKRFNRILAEFKLNLNLPWPPEGALARECERWWDEYIAEDLRQAFEWDCGEVRLIISKTSRAVMPSEGEVTKLLEALESMEDAAAAIPIKVLSKKPKPEKESVIERKPKLVKLWRALRKFLSTAHTPLRTPNLGGKQHKGVSGRTVR